MTKAVNSDKPVTIKPRPKCPIVGDDALKQEISGATGHVKASIGHQVCEPCGGDGCKVCHKRGWVTKREAEQYGMSVQ